MQIELEIEKELTDEQKKGLIWILNAANESSISPQQRLDFARIQVAGLGYWAYRGGNHVAVHLMTRKGPDRERSAIFAIE